MANMSRMTIYFSFSIFNILIKNTNSPEQTHPHACISIFWWHTHIHTCIHIYIHTYTPHMQHDFEKSLKGIWDCPLV